jgi:hypothetical protein
MTAVASQNGQPDSYFIARIRRELRDKPRTWPEQIPTDGVSGTLTAAGFGPYQLKRAPVVASGVVLTAPGGPYTVVYDTPPAAGQVEIITETGEIVFPAAPAAAGNILVTYQSARFSDTQILEALSEGMNIIWPEIWNPQRDIATIQLSPVSFEYPLPAVFADQRAVMLEVEYMPPSGIVRSYRKSDYRILDDIVQPLLIFQRHPGAVGTIRLTFTVPFSTLAQVPTIAMHLPIYYAMVRLMADQESMRSRSDDLPALTGETPAPPGTALQIAEFWLGQFFQQLNRLDIGEPMRTSVRSRVTEKLRGAWARSA